MFNIKKLNIASLSLFVLFLLFTSTVSAESSDIKTTASSSREFVQLLENVLVSDSEGNQVVELKEGALFYADANDKRGHTVQVGNELVDLEEQQYIVLDERNLDYISDDETSSIATFQNKTVYDSKDNGTAIAHFKEELELLILEEDDQFFQVIFGNRMAYILKEEVVAEEPVEEETSKEEPDDSDKSEEQQDDSSPADTKPAPAPEKENVVSKETDSATKQEKVSNNKVTAVALPSFTGKEVFFKAHQAATPVYINQNGQSIKVGQLTEGQEYVINGHSDGWLRIRFGNYVGYVRQSSVIPSNGATIKNLNTTMPNSDRSFTTTRSLVVYDNTSGSLVEFARIDAGHRYPIIRQTSPDWYQIDLAGRLGFVYIPHLQVNLTSSDKFVTALSDNAVYINRNGKSEVFSSLKSGQEYAILGEIPGFIRINFGHTLGYIRYKDFRPSVGSSIKNPSKEANSNRMVYATRDVVVYDNTSGSLVEFGKILASEKYPIVRQTSPDWYLVNFAGRAGYIYRPHANLLVNSTDKYFRTKEATTVEVNQVGQKGNYAELAANQEYQITGLIDGFIRINYGGVPGYIRDTRVEAGNGASIKNHNTSLTNSNRLIQTYRNLPVYDNTSGSLVEFGTLYAGQTYPIIQETSQMWLQLDLAGRIGYVYKPQLNMIFQSEDKYFQPLTDNVPVYMSENQTTKQVGNLINGEKYVINQINPDMIRISFGTQNAYVRASDVYPTSSTGIGVLATGSENSIQTVRSGNSLSIFSGISSSSTKIAVVNGNQTIEIVEQTSPEWLKVIFAGKVGYISKSAVDMKKLIAAPYVKLYSTYGDATFGVNTRFPYIKFGEAVEILDVKEYVSQVKLSDGSTGWVHTDYIVDDLHSLTWLVKGARTFRSGPGASYSNIGSVPAGATVTVIDYSIGEDPVNKDWYKIVTANGATGWIWAGDVNGFNVIRYNHNQVGKTVNDLSIFTPLSSLANVTAKQIDDFINFRLRNNSNRDSSLMVGMGSVYLEAQQASGLNALYLIAHSALETGWGTSSILKDKYNYFGIGAFDSCPSTCASPFEGQKAGLIEGAKWISRNYVNHNGYQQITIDNMRNNNNVHQYATDEAWSVKIANIAKSFLDFISGK